MPVQPRTAPREPDCIREVFVSATAKDVAAYRTGVRDHLLKYIQTAVFLQEDWSEPAMGVVELCLKRLVDSDGYIGVFGFRYGWIPEREQRSITEIECDGALQHWGRDIYPPLFIFLPEPGSEAARELDAAAVRVLAEDFPGDDAGQASSRAQQKVFCDRLRSKGDFIKTFSTLAELSARAQASVSHWNQEILKRALKGLARPRDVPDSELGRIDREPQTRALEDAFVELQGLDEPGMAVVVHGAENAGQFAFLAFLESWATWDISRPVLSIDPPHDKCDTASVLAAMIAAAVPVHAVHRTTVEDLAAALVERCRDETVVMVLPNADRITGGFAALQKDLWKPLIDAARERRRIVGETSPFVLVTSATSVVSVPAASAWGDDAAAGLTDVTRLFVLPELAAFTRSHILDWLSSSDRGGTLSATARSQVAARVLGDGVPRAVFDRLRNERIWQQLNQ